MFLTFFFFVFVFVLFLFLFLFCFVFHIFYCHFENKKVFTRLSVYSIYIFKLLLIINYICIFKQFYNYICKLLFLLYIMFLRFGKAEWDCVTKGNIFMCARYFLCFQVYCLSCRRKLQRYGFQNLILDILYSFKHIWKICLFFY